MREYSQDLCNCIENALIHNNYKYTFDEETGVFRMFFSIAGPISQVSCRALVMEEAWSVASDIDVHANVDDFETTYAVLELISRINWETKHWHGRFVVDMSDGEILFVVNRLQDDEDAVSETVVENAIFEAVHAWRRFGRAFTSVIFGEASAKDALAASEARFRKEREEKADAADDDDNEGEEWKQGRGEE